MKVWILIAQFYYASSGGPVVIDNIASEEDCRALAADIQKDYQKPNLWSISCVSVNKAIAKAGKV